jgi:hypothetical protein
MKYGHQHLQQVFALSVIARDDPGMPPNKQAVKTKSQAMTDRPRKNPPKNRAAHHLLRPIFFPKSRKGRKKHGHGPPKKTRHKKFHGGDVLPGGFYVRCPAFVSCFFVKTDAIKISAAGAKTTPLAYRDGHWGLSFCLASDLSAFIYGGRGVTDLLFGGPLAQWTRIPGPSGVAGRLAWTVPGQLDEAAPRGRTVYEPPMSYRAPCALCRFALAFVCSFSLSDAVTYGSLRQCSPFHRCRSE